MADREKGNNWADAQIAKKPKALGPKSFAKEVRALWEKGLPPGFKTGWPSLDKHYTVAPGQFTVITGWPGAGKSEWLDALLVNLSRQGWKIALFSPENAPTETHIAKLMEKLAGKPFGAGPNERISLDELAEVEDEIDQSFAFLSCSDGAIAATEVIAAAEPWLDQFRESPKGVVIDPWNELEHWRPPGLSETEYISMTLSLLRNWARTKKVHVWIVAHPQKMRRDDGGKLPVPKPDMIAGCHSADTEVLTQNRGWVQHAEITLFDRVACFDPTDEVMRYERPSKLWDFDHDGEMHRWRSPSYDALVTPNHRMIVRPNWRRKPSYAARAVMNGVGRPVAYAIDDAWNFVESKNMKSDMEMPWATRFENSTFDLDNIQGNPADATLKFLGDWISEGWACGRSGIGVCQAVGAKANAMRAAIVGMGVRFTERMEPPRRPKDKATMWKGYVLKSQFTEWVKAECGIGAQNKRIPDFVWSLSDRQKEILFDALMDGDGSWQTGRDNIGSYATTSSVLAGQMQRLAIELGRMACINSASGTQNHHLRRYQVSIGSNERKYIAIRPIRNLERTTYKGKVYCLTVPTGAYLVRRNGKVGIFGNSAHWWNKSDNAITVYRDLSELQSRVVDIYVQKIRFKHIGFPGMVSLTYDRVTGRYHEPRQASLYAVAKDGE